MRRRRHLAVALAGAWLLAGACAAPAAPPGTPSGTAPFGDARALGTDAAGRLYVADGASSSVVVLSPGRERLPPLGGPSASSETALAEPSDVDPGSGLSVLVADALAGAVVRFTSDGRAAEVVAVPALDPGDGAAPPPDAVRDASDRRRPRGRPVAVAALPGGGMAVAEASRGAVLVLDDRRRVERAIRRAGVVGLAVGPDGALWVADASRGTLAAYSVTGRLVHEFPVGGIGTLRRVRRDGTDGLLAVGTDGIARLARAPDGTWRIDTVLPAPPGPPPVDAARAPDGSVWFLTATALLRANDAP